MYNVITVWVSEQKGKIGTFSTWIYDQAASICWLDFWTSGIWDWKKREVKSNDYKRWWFCCQWISVSEMFGSADALEVGLHMGPEAHVYSSKSTNGGKGLKNSKINSYFTPW